jgi:hypothetical protein
MKMSNDEFKEFITGVAVNFMSKRLVEILLATINQ